MSKKKEFSFLVKANVLALSFLKLKESIQLIVHPLLLLPKDCVTSLYNDEETTEAVKILLKGDYTKFETRPPKQLDKYAKLSYDTSYICGLYLNEYNRHIEEYVQELPENIQALKKLKKELKQLIKEADKREYSLFKSGNLKKSIYDIIELQEVDELIIFSEEARDNICLNTQFFMKNIDKGFKAY